MAKAVIIELDGTIPDTEQNQVVTITIVDSTVTPPVTRTYTGKLSTILTYNPLPVVPAATTVTIKAPGLVTQ